ncbi:cytochrome P450 71AU50-like [Cornus florida]|uniref:cytochrome P450 71AU50-like n=1 Tax=Cornus florida TaxID=4283 RepID=UPI00289A7100|nr:cytochrome P450 71AU50-like [Cornus florida]
MAWNIWVTLALVAIFVYLLQLACSRKNNSRRLPPGPKAVPILGHFHLLGKLPHHDLHQLAKTYGPIMFMRFGFVPNIVVSSPEAAEQFLKTHDLVFASRPPHEAAKYIAFEQRNLTFAEYGPYWRNMRKFCTLQLLSNLKINSFQAMRKEELGFLIKLIEQAACDGVAVDLSAKVSSAIADMTCLMVFGKKYTDKDFNERGFKAVIQEGMQLAATPNLGDYFPYVGALDLQGLTRRMKAINKVFDGFFEKIIDEHLQARDQRQTKDFVDIMLDFMQSEEAEFRIDRSHVKAIMLDMLAAAMDTSATSIEWVLSELLKHPRVMKKVQKELEDVVGVDRLVEESDLESLEYMDMVLKESFRLHPVAPLLLPHEAMEECTINGFHIPKKSRVTINVWAIGRDPNSWINAEKFIPERFAGSDIDIRGRDFQLLPFGSGRRGCPGMQLGLTLVRLVVAQLVHCFDWELPNDMLPSELDMSEEFGLVTARATHLLAIPTYRLHK